MWDIRESGTFAFPQWWFEAAVETSAPCTIPRMGVFPCLSEWNSTMLFLFIWISGLTSGVSAGVVFIINVLVREDVMVVRVSGAVQAVAKIIAVGIMAF